MKGYTVEITKRTQPVYTLELSEEEMLQLRLLANCVDSKECHGDLHKFRNVLLLSINTKLSA